MPDPSPDAPRLSFKNEIDIPKLWAKYEDIAMHFNDLLMRLRSQSLAGIAAISTLVGIFAKEGTSNFHMDWVVATGIFVALAFFWIAIWCLDYFYYSKLLLGAVAEIIELEKMSKISQFSGINMSTRIAHEFDVASNRKSFNGVCIFYALVLGVIVCGVAFCLHMQRVASGS